MYKRRIIVFLVLIGLALVGLLARVWYLQVLRGDEYLQYAQRRLRDTEMLPAMRGRILDRAGKILAIDQPCFELCIEYPFLIATPEGKWARRHVGKIAKAAGLDTSDEAAMAKAWAIYWKRRQDTLSLVDRIARGRGVNLSNTIQSIIRRVERMRGPKKKQIREQYTYHAVVEGLNDATAVAIKAQMADTMCLKVRPAHKRIYPRNSVASHIIGLTGKVNPTELAEQNRALYEKHEIASEAGDWLAWQRDRYNGSDVIGKAGVEKMSEGFLRGRRGYRISRAGVEIQGVPATPGGDVHLSIDAELQDRLAEAFVADDRFPGGTGAIVVLDVTTNQLLAMVSIPTYDLNRYRSREYFDELTKSQRSQILLPLRHRAVTQCYAPGSTAKPVAALAALGAERIHSGTTFVCREGYLFPNMRDRWKCWSAKRGYGHDRIDLLEGIRFSCNVYFYNVGEILRPAAMCEWLRLFGFGSPPGTGLPEERSGVVPTDDWMRRRYNRAMSIGDARMMAIGQGPFSATPLHVANAMATIARGGEFSSAVLVLEGGPSRVRRDLPLGEHHIQTIQQGMREVVHDPAGTAYRHVKDRLGTLGFEVCGKTGTAEVPPQRLDSDGDGRITTADEPIRWGDAAWFAGFAPYRNPKIAFVVLVEYVEGGGGANAGPLAMDVVQICKELGYVP